MLHHFMDDIWESFGAMNELNSMEKDIMGILDEKSYQGLRVGDARAPGPG